MGVPLTSSGPLPSLPPRAPALRVEIVGDEFGIWLSVASAVVGAVAAIASWKAATAARKAAEIGEESARYARDAASAAQNTAEAEHAMLAITRYEYRARQASEIYIAWAGVSRSAQMSAAVELQAANRSGLVVSDIEYFGVLDGVVVTEVLATRYLNAGAVPTLNLKATSPIPESYASKRALGVIRFTDINGVRWERRTSSAPVEVAVSSPSSGAAAGA